MIGIVNHIADNGQRFGQKKARTDNSTYPKGGVLCSKDCFVVNQTLAFQIKFCSKSPALRVAAKRYHQCCTTIKNSTK